MTDKRPIHSFCNRNIFCFRPLGHEGDCLLQDSTGEHIPRSSETVPQWRKRLTARDETGKVTL